MSSQPVTTPLLKVANVLCTLIALALAVALIADPELTWAYWVLVIVSLAIGLFLVMPIGGADMPVVIALLNSYSGLAAAATGFVIDNNVLIVAGSLVGASGLILTKIMCVAMNRSLTNVLFGVMAEAGVGPSADEIYAGKVKSATPEEVALLFDTARQVLIVPGYGMAVAQAQHIVRDLATLLESRGVTVEYGIHPVAGRMPGHMNVLLAEADVPYEQLKEMDEVNSTMNQVDVALVIGANDTVNPIARDDPASAIAGMPIIERGPRPDGGGGQAQPEPGLRGHSQPALRGQQHPDDVRRRQEGDPRARRRPEADGLIGHRGPASGRPRIAPAQRSADRPEIRRRRTRRPHARLSTAYNPCMTTTNGQTVEDRSLGSVTIRFCGDSGDGMQLTGSQFTSTAAVFGNDVATFPDFPAEIRAPRGTTYGVSGFQVQFASSDIFTPGDSVNALVAMNPAAFKTNIADVDPGRHRHRQRGRVRQEQLQEVRLPRRVQPIG